MRTRGRLAREATRGERRARLGHWPGVVLESSHVIESPPLELTAPCSAVRRDSRETKYGCDCRTESIRLPQLSLSARYRGRVTDGLI